MRVESVMSRVRDAKRSMDQAGGVDIATKCTYEVLSPLCVEENLAFVYSLLDRCE
jgi:hypothetical protein